MAKIKTLVFLGDLMLGRRVSRKINDHAPEWFWGSTLPILQRVDAAVANLESPITRSDARWNRSWKMFHFRADPAAIHILQCANIRFVSLANNHALDFGEAGLFDTIRALDAADIRHAGAGRNVAAAAAPAILELSELKVGFIAATDTMRPFAAGTNSAGTHFIEISDENKDAMDWIERSVVETRQAGADMVVLSLHWGPNLRISPTRRFRLFAHAAIERGVDVIHGHSAHVAQAVERHKNGLILYGTGNFIDDSWKVPFHATTTSFVFVLEIVGRRPSRLRMLPIHLEAGTPQRTTGKKLDDIKRRMKHLCAALGVPIVDVPDGLELIIYEQH